MKKILSGAILLSIVVALGLYLKFKNANHSFTDPSKNIPAASTQNNTPLTAKAPEQKPEQEPPTQNVNPQFIQYLRAEAQRMDAPSVDQEKVQKEIEAQVEKMTPKELEYAKNIALSPNRSANEKILAVYLILNAKNSVKTLEELITAPLKHKPNAERHSVEETAAMQEKTLRIMEIDGLLQRAVKDQSIRDSLARIATSLSDPTLKAYLIKKLKELPPI